MIHVPAATYRLQFNNGFRFADAKEVLEYLHDLGISHVYASPLFKAQHGSAHGYDVTDPTAINPEIGTRQEFEDFVRRLHANELHLLLDIVPNHMAASIENPWWIDVLANGRSSRYAEFFDIDWSSGKVLLPILAEPYGACLEAGQFSIQRNNGHFILRYSNYELPVHVQADAHHEGETVDILDRVITAQPYRLAHWRKASDAINYRRFFDINDLISLRTERNDVFEATHAQVFDLIRQGIVDGLRIDHIDGLLDPQGYLERLPEMYVVVEKILAGDETLPTTWRTHGTTGYDFLNVANGVFVDPSGFQELRKTYAHFTGLPDQPDDVFRSRKRQVMNDLFAGEVTALSHRLAELAQSHRHARDLSMAEIQEALISVTACLPIYRTYIRDLTISDLDQSTIRSTLAAAEAGQARDAIAFLGEVLLLDPPYYLQTRRRDYLDFVLRWQQFTGPVMAKGLEDTTFYVHNPLIALNEVGGDARKPEIHFGIDAFHRYNIARRQRDGYSLNAGSTHDTKRSEDVRARIDVLSEIPEQWRSCLERWRRRNAPNGIPDANEQIFIYQTLLGAWPISQERLHEYLIKALREAKTHTNWLRPDASYEREVLSFVDRILDPHQSKPFLKDFFKLQRKIAFFGALNSLGEVLLRITCPGVPDIYQGMEQWNFSLADPDNRRPVDFETRIHALDWLRNHARPAELLDHWMDGRIKLFVVWKALNFRRDNLEVFLDGEYVPIEVTGKRSDNVIAFARRLGEKWVVVAVPRLMSQVTATGKPPLGRRAWGNTRLILREGAPQQWRDVFTGQELRSPLEVSSLFSTFPLALLG